MLKTKLSFEDAILNDLSELLKISQDNLTVSQRDYFESRIKEATYLMSDYGSMEGKHKKTLEFILNKKDF